jgi:colicin import membrane protein
MSHQFDISTSQNQPSFIWVAFFVIALHLGLVGAGKFWDLSPPKPKERAKVIVQTITLQPARKEQIKAAPPASPPLPQQIAEAEISRPVPQKPPAPIVESPPKAEKVILQEEPLPKKEQAAPKEQPPPAPKTEAKPQPKPVPKPVIKEAKPPAPVKKAAEEVKKAVKKENKINQQAEKAKQEKIEAEKKKQQERAEAEKKRQKEIAAVEEAARKKEQALLSKAKESLAKMGETRDKISISPSISIESTAIPKEIGSLQVDAIPFDGGISGDWGSKEISYTDEVGVRLKKGLKLPDYGAVKIKLTLDRTGKVVKVETISFESQKNKAYAESKIPTLLFPPFGQRFKESAQNTFVFILKNDS